MATNPASFVPIDEYIARFIDRHEKPACEYVDGTLIPKPMAGDDHSAVQSNLVFYLRSRYNKLFKIRPELHAKVRQTRFRVPDIAVLDRSQPFEGRFPGPGNPVYLCIEIKSPDDALPQLWEKCREYHVWGVMYCWMIDPEAKRMWEYHAADKEPRPMFDRLSAGTLEVSMDEIFEDL
jgi:Uma2 family endonuclease